MRQQQGLPLLPPGYDENDIISPSAPKEDTSAAPMGMRLERTAVVPREPQAPPKPQMPDGIRFKDVFKGAVKPLSPKDEQGNWKVPDIIRTAIDMLPSAKTLTPEETAEMDKGDFFKKDIDAVKSMAPVRAFTGKTGKERGEAAGESLWMLPFLMQGAKAGARGLLNRGPTGPKSISGTPEPAPIDVEARAVSPKESISGSGQKQLKGNVEPKVTISRANTVEAPSSPVKREAGLAAGPKPPKQIESGGVHAIPAASEAPPIKADSRLPESYARAKAEPPKAPPGVMGRANLGEEGGIPKRGEQTVTPVKPTAVRSEKGVMRKGTPSDLLNKAANSGRTASNAVTLPDGKVHIPSSLELERGYVLVNGKGGRFTKLPIKK